MTRTIRHVIDDRVRTVLARWVDLLLVVLVAIVLVVVFFGFVWDPAAIQNIQTCPVHAPGQTPWPQVPHQCLAGW